MYSDKGNSVFNQNWVSPFGYLRIKAYLPAPRSFSQAITSFIGITCQGIRCVPLSNFLCIGLTSYWFVSSDFTHDSELVDEPITIAVVQLFNLKDQ